MTDDSISTGLPALDEDLYDIYWSGIEKLFDRYKREELSAREVIERLPQNAIKAMFFLVDEKGFNQLLNDIHPDANEFVRSVQKLAKDYFLPLLEDQNAYRLAAAIRDEPSKAQLNSRLSRNRISNVRSDSAWNFGAEIEPAFEAILMSDDDNVLLKSRMNWDDAIFVAYRLIDEVVAQSADLDNLSDLAKEKLDVKELYGQRVPLRLKKIDDDIRELRRILIKLGYQEGDFLG